MARQTHVLQQCKFKKINYKIVGYLMFGYESSFGSMPNFLIL